MKLGYDEAREALDVRIAAHKRYSSLRVEDVLEELLGRRFWPRILDVGCGSGNYTELLARHCSLNIGLDKNIELLRQAQQRCQQADLDHILFMQFDMNEPFPFLHESFDLVFYGYSAYYADDAASLVCKSKDVLCEDGTLVMVGPVTGNAVELDTISHELFGVSASGEKVVRVNRLAEEFVPIMESEFSKCEVVQKDFSLIFPSVDEYTEYYLATPQYVELAKRFAAPDLGTVKTVIGRLTSLGLTKKSLLISADR